MIKCRDALLGKGNLSFDPRIINHEMADKKPVEYMKIFPQLAKPSVRDSL